MMLKWLLLSLSFGTAALAANDKNIIPSLCVGALTSYQEELSWSQTTKREQIAKQADYFIALHYQSEGQAFPGLLERVFFVNKMRERVEQNFNMFELPEIRKTCQEALYKQ